MLSLTRIEHLADQASLQRGRNYFRDRRVTQLTTSQNGTVRAVVEGEQLYRVVLRDRTWDCTCPVGVQGTFCKHCVAVALAANSEQGDVVTPAADAVLAETRKRILGSIRTRRDMVDWRAVSSYAAAAGTSVDELRTAALQWGPAKIVPIAEAAINAAVKVILRADDSNGEIGDIIAELLEVHAELCAEAPPKRRHLVDWIIAFQFDGTQDFYNIDVADYATALGPEGLEEFTKALDTVETGTMGVDSTVQYNRERLAVAIGDPGDIIASFQPLTRSYRMHDLAKALVEVGAVDMAIRFAQNAAGAGWTDRAEQVYARLNADHLIETLLRLKQDERAWKDAHGHPLNTQLWTRLVAVRLKTDPASAIPKLKDLIDADLTTADLRGYKSAVRRLKQLRTALRPLGREGEFAGVVCKLRDENRRRPRLLQELERL